MKESIIFAAIFLITLADKVSTQTPDDVYVPDVCICVTTGYCDLAGGGGSTDGSGLIDPRIMTVN